MTQQELNAIIENHKHWLNQDCDGWVKMRANLVGANLKDANLAGANLERANLTDANLEGANLEGANLKGAFLERVFLKDANLTDSNLAGANLKGANLAGANLTGSCLECAILVRANLKCVNIADTNLAGIYLREAKNVPFIPLACPDSGSFIAYKKASGYIVKLQIPKDAKRLSATGRKCRCDKAKVLEIQNLDGTIADITRIRSNFDETFAYEVGKIVSVDDFDEDRWNECSTGIHFFMNRQEAVNW